MRKINLIICLVALMSTASFSQYIKMGVSSVKAENAEQQQQMEGTLKTMKMETFANDDQVRTDVNMMGGMVVMSTFTNPKTDEFIMYMDMMGNKILKYDLKNDDVLTLPLNNLVSGVYNVQIVSGKNFTTKKLIIQ